jgi:hypothetical protein
MMLIYHIYDPTYMICLPHTSAARSALRAEAARKGDIDAILALYEATPKEQTTTRESILNGGVRVGSSECLLARGKMYLKQGKTQEAKTDFLRAAEFGDWSALQEYMRVCEATLDSRWVSVSPLSAHLKVLEMRTPRALAHLSGDAPPLVVTALPNDSDSSRFMAAAGRPACVDSRRSASSSASTSATATAPATAVTLRLV